MENQPAVNSEATWSMWSIWPFGGSSISTTSMNSIPAAVDALHSRQTIASEDAVIDHAVAAVKPGSSRAALKTAKAWRNSIDPCRTEGPSRPCLSLRYCEGYDDLLNFARFAHDLEVLDFSYTRLTDENLQMSFPLFAKNNPHLKAINIGHTYISKETLIKLLEAFPHLEELSMYSVYTLIKSELVDQILLENNELLDILLPWIKTNPNLKKLTGDFTFNSREQFDAFTEAVPEGLEEISIYLYPEKASPEMMDHSFPKFAEKCSRLKALTLSGNFDENGNTILPAHFKALPKQLPFLQRFDFEYINMELSSEDIRSTYMQWEEMRSLNFYGNVYMDLKDEDVFAIIRHFKRLEEINIYFTSEMPTENFAKALMENPLSLKKLTVPFMEYKAEGLDPFFTIMQPLLGQLERFEINWISINDEDLRFLAEHFGSPNLKELNVDFYSTFENPKVNMDKSLAEVIKILQRSPNIQNFGLHGNFYFTNHDFLNLSEVLKHLRRLDLTYYHSLQNSQMQIPPLANFINHNLELEEMKTTLDQAVVEELKKICPRIGKSVFVKGKMDLS